MKENNSQPLDQLPDSQHKPSSQLSSQQLDLEDMLAQLKTITQGYKPASEGLIPGSVDEQRDQQLWQWLMDSLSEERFRKMSANLEAMCEGAEHHQLQKAKEIELLALKLDIDQAQEINRGKQFNIIKK